MTEFLAKWIAAACLLAWAWPARPTTQAGSLRTARRRQRRRALGLVLAALALLAFEVGIEESLLELACAWLLTREAFAPAGRGGGAGTAVRAGTVVLAAVLAWFAVSPLRA